MQSSSQVEQGFWENSADSTDKEICHPFERQSMRRDMIGEKYANTWYWMTTQLCRWLDKVLGKWRIHLTLTSGLGLSPCKKSWFRYSHCRLLGSCLAPSFADLFLLLTVSEECKVSFDTTVTVFRDINPLSTYHHEPPWLEVFRQNSLEARFFFGRSITRTRIFFLVVCATVVRLLFREHQDYVEHCPNPK